MVTRTPHPTLLSRDSWTKCVVWFTCRMLWDFPPGFREFLASVGRTNDIRLVSDLCTRKVIFWEPKSTWFWKSSSVSNRADWMVLAQSYRVEKGEVLMTVHSLYQGEHHRNGDIRVTSKENGPSIRQLILEHSRRAGLTIVLSEDELGDPTQYTGADLPTQQDRSVETPQPPRYTQTTLSNRPTTQETPRITCEFDFSSLKPTTTRWSHNQHFVSVTCRKRASSKIMQSSPPIGNVSRNRSATLDTVMTVTDNMGKEWRQNNPLVHINHSVPTLPSRLSRRRLELDSGSIISLLLSGRTPHPGRRTCPRASLPVQRRRYTDELVHQS